MMADNRIYLYKEMLGMLGAEDTPELRGILGAPEGTFHALMDVVQKNMIKTPNARLHIDRPDNHMVFIATHEGIIIDVFDDNEKLVDMRCRAWDELDGG